MEFEFRSGGKTTKYTTNGMCTLELHHGGWFENGVYKKGKQSLEIRYRNVEGGQELLTSDAKVVEMVGHIPSNKIIHFSQVKEVAYIEDEETFENVGTKVANEDAGAELPNHDVGANMTIYDEEAELSNENEDLEFKDSDYELSENEAEVRLTVGENVADERTNHGALGEVSSDGGNTSKFDTGSEIEDEGNDRKKKKMPKFK
ncbi:unnamed protein product [Prunus armeniaca]